MSVRLVGQLAWHFLAEREGLVAVVKVYMDEAGTDSASKVLTVAGYAARPSRWQAFTREWNAVLRPTGIKCYHATDAQACQGEFRQWKPEQVAELASALLPIIPRYAAGLAVSIVMPDYRAAISQRPELETLFASPYAACFQWLVQSLLSVAQERKAKSRFSFVHETNDMRRDAQEAFYWMKAEVDSRKNLVSLVFADKAEFVPLQAADILAFEVGKRLGNQTGPERRALTTLNPGGGKIWIRFYDKRNMPHLISVLEKVTALKKQVEGQSS